jgi:hypothetical protein
VIYRELELFYACTAPIDLEDVSSEMFSSQSFTQHAIHSAIGRSMYRSTVEVNDEYEKRKTFKLTPRTLKSIYESSTYNNAIQYMRNYRPFIQIEDTDVLDHSNPFVIWNAGSAHKLDFLCVVGNQIGLHVALQNGPENTNLDYAFNLLPDRRKRFSGKYVQLGHNQEHSLLHIGDRPGEEIFIDMMPKEVLSGNTDLPEVGLCTGTGSTILQEDHFRIISSFLAYCLSLNETTSVHCIDAYDIPMPPESMSWLFTSAL